MLREGNDRGHVGSGETVFVNIREELIDPTQQFSFIEKSPIRSAGHLIPSILKEPSSAATYSVLWPSALLWRLQHLLRFFKVKPMS